MNNHLTTQDLQGNLDAATEQAAGGLLSVLRRTTELIKEKAELSIIHFAQPILTRTNTSGEREAAIFPNTINLVSGLSGVHKSRFCEMLLASFIQRGESPSSLLSFERNSGEYVVALVDTERNISDQLPYAVQQIRENAGFERSENIPIFEYTSLLNIKREMRLFALQYFFTTLRGKHPHKHIIILIDVCSDLCENFNDPRSAMPIVDELNDFINTYNCTVIGVIHQNPSGFNDKSRGHLGTELENKASTVMTIAAHKDKKEVYVITCKKQRSAKPFQAFCAAYDEDTRRLVEQEGDTKSIAKSPMIIDWYAVFGNDTELFSRDVHTRLQQLYGYALRQSQTYTADAIRRKEINEKGKGKARTLYIAKKGDTVPNSIFETQTE